MTFLNRTDLASFICGAVWGCGMASICEMKDSNLSWKEIRPSNIFMATAGALFLTIPKTDGLRSQLIQNFGLFGSLIMITQAPLLAKRIGITFFDGKPLKLFSFQSVKIIAYAVANFASFHFIGKIISPYLKPEITTFSLTYLGILAVWSPLENESESVKIATISASIASLIFASLTKTSGMLAGLFPLISTYVIFLNCESFLSKPHTTEKILKIAAGMTGLFLSACVGSYLDVRCERNGV